MSTGQLAHSSSSPSSSAFPDTGTQHSDTPAGDDDEDEYERLMRSSPTCDLDHHDTDVPSDSAAYNNQGQRWDNVIDPALSAADSTATLTVISRPGGVRNESAAARRLAEREKLLPYQRTTVDEFTQVWFLWHF